MYSSIANIRTDYTLNNLSELDTPNIPMILFSKWWNEAIASKIEEVNAMTLSTVDKTGIPNARIVLLKEFNEHGFQFFTNYLSEKGQELENNNNACLLFFWKELQRQVRIKGCVQKLSTEQNQQYFSSRPLESQLSACVSKQSKILENRQVLETEIINLKNNIQENFIPCPAYWGGYNVMPYYIEFWQGRPNRLHDRICYQKLKKSGWNKYRIAP
ncbi:MAG: pyridoxamine 5'-phosphate oxidase [Sediminibacterium sp.]|nr:pyridoxamine 5'-phosphate oxidase [Sediminibacterium sp.]